MPFIERYKPKKISEVLGQDAALGKILDFINNFKRQKRKALLLYGPTGVGKTASVYAIAQENDLEIVEINASDIRNKESINSIVGAASKQMSLFFKRKVILVDEIDGIAGREDYGGLPALAAIVGKNSFPIIFTANDPYDKRFSELRKKSELLEFMPLSLEIIVTALRKICEREKIKHSLDDLKAIARRSGGDLRAAINDLQTLSGVNKEIDRESIASLSDRDREESMQNALLRVFKSTDPKLAVGAFDNVPEDLDKSFLWVDENLPLEYRKASDLSRAFDYLSKADVFKGRISRRQDWRYLVYFNSLMSAGVAVAKDEKSREVINYKPTSRILKLWIAKQRFLKRQSIAAKIASRCHCSIKRAQMDYLPYIRAAARKGFKGIGAISDELELNSEEMEWLKR